MAESPAVPPDLLTLWNRMVEADPDRPTVHFLEHTITAQELDGLARSFAAGLRASGVEPGDRVGVLLQNDPQWPLTLLACWMLGAIVVPLNPMFRARELRTHLDDARPRVLVCLDELYESIARETVVDTSVERVVLTAARDLNEATCAAGTAPADAAVAPATGATAVRLRELLVRHQPSEVTPRRPASDDVALLTYTSGTTGPPKGAMNSHGNVAYTAEITRAWFDLGNDDVVAGIAPLFHITGLVLHVGVAWTAGAPLVLFHRFEPRVALQAFARWRVTFSVAAITAYIALLEHPDFAKTDLSALKKVASGGAPINPAVAERWLAATGAPLHNVYGLTETTSPSHLVPRDAPTPVDPRSGAMSVGVPVPGTDVCVVDSGTGREVPVGSPGELVISGPGVVCGYWGQAEETQRAIPDGRLHTGDIGFMDDDGWFYIVDRAKDQINAAGFKVWPREVEDILFEHPAVREAAVVGVADDYRGETVKAFVSLRRGQRVTEEELIAFARSRLAAYKYPRRVEILDELPKTPTGKLLRRALRARDADDGGRTQPPDRC